MKVWRQVMSSSKQMRKTRVEMAGWEVGDQITLHSRLLAVGEERKVTDQLNIPSMELTVEELREVGDQMNPHSMMGKERVVVADWKNSPKLMWTQDRGEN